jgi:hypothetical protein
MGGGDIILTEAEMQGESIAIDTFVMMGGIDIVVPPHWDVVIKGVPILGGIDNKTAKSVDAQSQIEPSSSAKKLVIKGLVIMGGIGVKNRK